MFRLFRQVFVRYREADDSDQCSRDVIYIKTFAGSEDGGRFCQCWEGGEEEEDCDHDDVADLLIDLIVLRVILFIYEKPF